MNYISLFSFIAYFLSGFTALVYEITWVRLLKHVFGSESLALSTLLTVFIGGIALGTFLAGKIIEKYFRVGPDLNSKDSAAVNLGQTYLLLIAYFAIEIFLAIYASFVPSLLSQGILGKLWSIFAAFAFENFLFGALFKFIISGILLIIPTMFIGMSFPILSELVSSHVKAKHNYFEDKDLVEDEHQLVISNLYATNTLGAIFGSLLGGFLLLPSIGLSNSVFLAAGINVFVALMVVLVLLLNSHLIKNINLSQLISFVVDYGRKLSAKAEVNREEALRNQEGFQRYKKVLNLLIGIGFFIGFINLSLEILWTKVLTLVIGSSTYSVTIILASVLAGISFGAFLLNFVIGVIHRLRIDYLSFLKFGLFSFAVLIVVSSSLFNQLPWIFLKLSSLISQVFANFSWSEPWFLENLTKFSVAALIALPATLVEGLIFAFILFLVASDTNLIDKNLQEPVGARVAKTSAVNTFGAIIGSFLTGFVFMPFFSKFGSGVYYSLQLLIIIAFAITIAPAFLDEIKKSRFIIGASLLTVVLSLIFLPQLDPKEVTSGAAIYQGEKFKNISQEKYKKAIDQEVLFHKEGMNTVVTVTKNTSVNAYFLKNNGKIEAGMPIDKSNPSKADMQTQVLLGQIPVLLAPEARKALLIGMGSGITLKSLAQAGLETKLQSIEVCEIEELIYEAADKFFVKSYPSEININRHVADARNFLQALNASDEALANFDLIISQPSDPWISSDLFTKEFWTLISNNLSDNGVFVQWLQLYSIDKEYLTIALRTFQSIFPDVMVFQSGSAAELLLIGSKSLPEIDTLKIRKIIANDELRKNLEAINISNVEDLFANLVLVPNAVKKLVLGKTVKVNKFVTKIDATSDLKPKLTRVNLESNEEYLNAIDDFRGRINTDDNMLLEFHTPTRLSKFFESVVVNKKFLYDAADPALMLKFFAANKDMAFLLKLAERSNNLKLAQEIHSIQPSPASYWTLHNIHQENQDFERADAMLFEAKSRYSDIVGQKRRSKELVIFEGLMGEKKLDDFELEALANIYFENRSYRDAENLIEKAINMAEEIANGDVRKIRLAQHYLLKAKVLEARSKPRKDVYKAFKKALDNDKYSSDIYLVKAEYELAQAEIFIDEAKKHKKEAVESLDKALELNPNKAKANLLLALIYEEDLPKSQMKLMELKDDTKLNLTIKYLRNTLMLDAKSIIANYKMSKLQYMLGNMDLAYKHSSRLKMLCENFDCMSELGDDFSDSVEIYKKLDKLVPKG